MRNRYVWKWKWDELEVDEVGRKVGLEDYITLKRHCRKLRSCFVRKLLKKVNVDLGQGNKNFLNLFMGTK